MLRYSFAPSEHCRDIHYKARKVLHLLNQPLSHLSPDFSKHSWCLKHWNGHQTCHQRYERRLEAHLSKSLPSGSSRFHRGHGPIFTPTRSPSHLPSEASVTTSSRSSNPGFDCWRKNRLTGKSSLPETRSACSRRTVNCDNESLRRRRSLHYCCVPWLKTLVATYYRRYEHKCNFNLLLSLVESRLFI